MEPWLWWKLGYDSEEVTALTSELEGPATDLRVAVCQKDAEEAEAVAA